MGPNAQYYQRHRKTARNYTTVTRFENVIFGVMGDNFQHFLLVHMLLQTRELHNRRPWALLFIQRGHRHESIGVHSFENRPNGPAKWAVGYRLFYMIKQDCFSVASSMTAISTNSRLPCSHLCLL